ncbi:homeobox protein knotted-1-like LET12 [Humulus lupulus]|uniref:homeobox protein knotted-1-like LET12 n=1 Tax=Humulus lupulus TaxID=3486 RepID=UPI002B406751|nr:homeobox protein knotted-1-like LET12 [Humulus lupulus]
MSFHHHQQHHSSSSTNLPQEMAFHQNPFADQPSLSAGEDDVSIGVGAPTWLNSSVFRQQNLLHLLSESEPRNDDVLGAAEGSKMNDFIGDRRNRREEEEEDEEDEESEGAWFKADILRHPLYEQLLSAHVSCLRIATPVDQLPRIDEQLSQSQRVVSKYSELGISGGGVRVVDEKELDQFMTNYVILLCSLKEQLQQHVRVHAMEAVMACWELEQSLQSLTGVSTGEGTGATMSDDNEDQLDSDINLYDGTLDGPDSMGFGPLVPTETERSLMERVREELKQELKQGYKEKIVDIREEILRKRKAGKLPGGTTSLLKSWWQSHSKWPYPTEEDKAKLVQETGLQLKQINNWFINQRKRNWHNNLSPSPSSKSKRKR